MTSLSLHGVKLEMANLSEDHVKDIHDNLFS